MEGYSAKVISASRELSAKEKVMYKNFDNVHPLDELSADEHMQIKPVAWVVIEVHNEHLKDKSRTDYKKYLIEDENGECYITGSDPFWSAFMDIWSDMADEVEEWAIDIYKRPSKNYNGKDFITCAII